MLTFTEAVHLHRQHLLAKRRAPSTLSWYSEQFAAFETWRISQGLADAIPDADTIDAYLASQHTGHKPSTVHARFRALRALLLFLERRRKLVAADNPIHLVDAPSVPVEIRRHVTLDDLDALLASIPGRDWLDHRDKLILLILFYSGLRVGELCALAVDDVDVVRLEIVVDRGKGDRARVAPAPPEIRLPLSSYLFTRPNHTKMLLLASDGYGGSRGSLKPEGVRQMLIRRCKQAGIAYYSPHAFRHGFAMWMLNAGARLTTVSAAMGHSDPAVTSKIYAHTTATTVRREYDEARAALKKGRNT